MIHILSKLLSAPAYPLSLGMLLFITAFVLLLVKKQTIAIVCMSIGFFVLWFFSSPLIVHSLVRSLESKYIQKDTYPRASAVVLLSGGEVPRNAPRIFDETNEAGERIVHAARLFKKGFAPWLIASGGINKFVHEFDGTEADVDFRLLTNELGVDSTKIIRERRASNTHDNGVYVKKKLDSLGLPPVVILATSAMHMPRSVAVFKKLGFTVYPAPCDFREDAFKQYKILNLFPSEGALSQSRDFLHELYGIIMYKIFGWI